MRLPERAQTKQNLRAAARRPLSNNAKLAHWDGSRSFDCTIMDLSVSGARIRLSAAIAIPEASLLLDLRTHTAFETKLVWRNRSQAGVKFFGQHRLAQIEDPQLLFLRTLFFESCRA